ncbi:uncharacterized protein LOC143527574 isoform X2 [Brachyhypopomus gauderio]|uniref:uncharacterized protein LOC143527574 isoform X2 n=1 Tax=Brachyhypopomus gauderio TaxID=698409 RepID=UPI004041D03F
MSAHFSVMMIPGWILILFIYKTCPVQTTEAVKPHILIEPGTNITINCTFEGIPGDPLYIWYKQRLKQEPQQIGTTYTNKQAILSHPFNNSRFVMKWINRMVTLTILHATKDDEGTYFCSMTDGTLVKFCLAPFLTDPTTPAADPQYQHVVLLVILCLSLCVSVIWNLTVCSFSWTRESCNDTIKKGERPHDQNSEDQMQKIWSQGDEFTHVMLWPV